MSKLLYGIIGLLLVLLIGLSYMMSRDNDKIEYVADNKTQTNQNNTSNMDVTNENVKNVSGAIFHTNYGDIEVTFVNTAPNTVKNFASLVDKKFYDGVRFHRIIKGFMIQSGDPFSKDIALADKWGTGGPGYKFNDELSGNETYPQGTLAMANAGPDTNGSQFFIVTASPGAPLPPSYTVFGKVVKGMENALKIENVSTDPTNDRPKVDVLINSIELK